MSSGDSSRVGSAHQNCGDGGQSPPYGDCGEVVSCRRVGTAHQNCGRVGGQCLPCESAAGLLLLVAFAVFRLPPWLPLFAVESSGVDPSWQMLLNEAVPRGWTFGRDLFFTYGPFGFIHARMYHPETWAVVIAVWVGISVIIADLVWRVTGHGQLTATWRTLCGIAMLELMSRDAMAVCFSLHVFVFLEAAQLLCKDSTSQLSDATSPSIAKTHRAFASSRLCVKLIVELFQRIRLVLPILLLAALPWAKFSYFVTAAFLGCALVVVALLQRRFPWRAAFLFSACPLAWLTTGGSLAECREFIGTGFQLAGGYSTAMGLGPDSFAGTIVVVSGAAVVVLLPVWLISRLPHPDWRLRVVTMLFFLGLLFIAWKSCFVRYHPERVPVFLGTVLPLLAYGASFRRRRRDSVETLADSRPEVEGATGYASASELVNGSWKTHWRGQWHTWIKVCGCVGRRFVGPLLLAAVVLVISAGQSERGRLNSLSGIVESEVGPLRDQLSAITLSVKKPGWRKVTHEEQLEEIRSANPIPKIDGTVDVFPSKLIVAFAHGLSLQPRPVLQSYAAFTPALIERDAQHFAGANAADHVLLSVAEIDERLPTLEDSRSWLELLSNYELTDASCTLLKLSRRDRPRLLLAAEPSLRTTARYGEPIGLPPASSGLIWCRIQIKPSVQGRLASVLYRLPELRLRTTVSGTDGSARDFRLLPGSAETGFLLSPLVENREDLIRLWSMEDDIEGSDVGIQKRVLSISCSTAAPPLVPLLYQPEFVVDFFEVRSTEPTFNDSTGSVGIAGGVSPSF